MKTPLLIAAHNEERYLGRTLSRLPANLVEPMVVVNGSSDRTAEISRSFGVRTYELEAPGKLPALQFAMKQLGRQALDAMLFIDADAYPVWQSAWHASMVAAVSGNEPRGAVGSICYVDGSTVSNVLRSARRYEWYALRKLRNIPPDLVGMNMVLALRRPEALEAMLSLPHYWPGEDRAMGDVIVQSGGMNTAVTDLRSMVRASSRFQMPLSERLGIGKSETGHRNIEAYLKRGAPGSFRYDPDGVDI